MNDLSIWKKRLHREMEKLDTLWTPSLDEAWEKASSEVEKEIGELAEEFFQYYWEVFNVFCEETSLEEWEVRVSKSFEEASSQVAEAWEKVAEQAKIRVKTEAGKYIRNLFAKISDVNRNLRNYDKEFEKAKQLINAPKYEEAIFKFKEVTESYETGLHDIKDARRDVRGQWILFFLFGIGTLVAIIQFIL